MTDAPRRLGFSHDGSLGREALRQRLGDCQALLNEARAALARAEVLPDGSIEQDEQVGIIVTRLRSLTKAALIPKLMTRGPDFHFGE